MGTNKNCCCCCIFISAKLCHISVPSQPLQLFADTVNSTAIFVNWTEPAEMNGHLVKYQVCVRNTCVPLFTYIYVHKLY